MLSDSSSWTGKTAAIMLLTRVNGIQIMLPIFSVKAEHGSVRDPPLFRNGEMALSQDIGIRIKGASTRNAAMKRFNVYARSEYGDSKLNFDLIQDNKAVDDEKQIKKYDSFSLRAVSWINRWRDHIVQAPLKDIDNMATIDSDKAIVFLNGEYWGLYEIQEKISDYYIQSNYATLIICTGLCQGTYHFEDISLSGING